jgi:SNF2 family DNA or RNA helicase
MRIVDNRALEITTESPGQITTLIPKSRLVEGNKVLVHWGMEEVKVLNNLGHKAPSPILKDYNWPGQFTPFAHQKETAAFLTAHRRAFCFNEQGTSKTASCAWAADYLMNRGLVKRVLVICPVSIMDVAWRADLFRTVMHRRVDIAYHTDRKRRVQVVNGDAEFVIINYDGLKIVLDEILKAKFDLVIADEGSVLSNANIDRWKAVSCILGPDTWFWLLTGTPAAQSPAHAYGLAKLVNPSGVPKFFGTFRDRVMKKINNFKYVPRPEAKHVVHEVLQPAIRFTKAQCLDLPEMTYVTREVALSKMQERYYKMVKNQMRVSAAGETISAANAAIKINKLLQVSCGSAYSDDGEVVDFDIRPRFKVLMEIIDETSNKILIFVPFKNTMQPLQELLAKQGLESAVISGDVTPGKRTEIFNRFQNEDDLRVLLIQPQAASHGVTLTRADTVVWWGPVPSVETHEQANARVHRPGQRNPCTVFYLQGSHAERHIYNLMRGNLETHKSILTLYEELINND